MAPPYVLPHLRHRSGQAALSKAEPSIEQIATPAPKAPQASATPKSPQTSATPNQGRNGPPSPAAMSYAEVARGPSRDDSTVLSTGGVSLSSSRWAPKQHQKRASNGVPKIATQTATPVSQKTQSAHRNQSTSQASQKSIPGLTTGGSFTVSSPIATPVAPHAPQDMSPNRKSPKKKSPKKSNNNDQVNTTTFNNGASSSCPKPAHREKKKQVSGWLTKEEKRAMAKKAQSIASDEAYNYNGWDPALIAPDIDYNDPKNLLDWDGNLLPAPVEWANRRQCERDNWTLFIVEFLNNSTAYYAKNGGKFESNLIIDIRSDEYTGRENGDIVPKQWINEKIENQPLQSFWKNFVQSKDPEVIDPEDLAFDPFWLRYSDEVPFQTHLDVPEARCEPVSDEPPNAYSDDGAPIQQNSANSHRLWRRMKVETSNTAVAEDARKREQGDRQAKKQERAERNKRRAAQRAPKIIAPPNPLRPRANIFLRPVIIERDVQQIHHIYEHWVRNTCYATELQPPDVSTISRRLQYIKDAGLPMIVAIEDTNSEAHSRKKSGPPASMTATQEKIVGFGCAEETEGENSALSFCAELEIYLHKDWLNLGIGKNILDRMMYLLDPMHSISEVVPWLAPPDKPEYWTPGGKRVIGIVRVPVHYPSDERSRVVWIGEWLSKYGFTKQADFDEAGIKLEQWTRTAIFQVRTGTHLDPKSVVRSIITQSYS